MQISHQTTLLKVTEDIRTGIDRQYLTLLLLFDFSEALDTVSKVALTWLDSFQVESNLLSRMLVVTPLDLQALEYRRLQCGDRCCFA